MFRVVCFIGGRGGLRAQLFLLRLDLLVWGGEPATEAASGGADAGGGFFQGCLAKDSSSTPGGRRHWRDGIYDQVRSMMSLQGGLTIERMCMLARVSRATGGKQMPDTVHANIWPRLRSSDRPFTTECLLHPYASEVCLLPVFERDTASGPPPHSVAE